MLEPAPNSDVNSALRLLLLEVQAVLGHHFVGMYLYGSLASGDFNPHTSDIDFLVVTVAELPASIIAALETMHVRLLAGGSKWIAKLEGSYVPRYMLRRHNPADAPCPCINEGHFYTAGLGSDWVIQRYILREQGVVVTGPALKTMIGHVEMKDVQQAVRGFLREWWLPMLRKPDPRLQGGEYQAYAVLTLCRALYTLEQGALVSKPAAARWAHEVLGQEWSGLIEQALAWQPGVPLACMDETLGFIRYTLERSQVALAKALP